MKYDGHSFNACEETSRCPQHRTQEFHVDESEKIPDFGPKADAAVKAACAQFPDTFKLRNHEGTFRVSESASYVSRGVVMVYTQSQWTTERFKNYYGRDPRTPDEVWVDFAKGTVSELHSQIRR